MAMAIIFPCPLSVAYEGRVPSLTVWLPYGKR